MQLNEGGVGWEQKKLGKESREGAAKRNVTRVQGEVRPLRVRTVGKNHLRTVQFPGHLSGSVI